MVSLRHQMEKVVEIDTFQHQHFHTVKSLCEMKNQHSQGAHPQNQGVVVCISPAANRFVTCHQKESRKQRSHRIISEFGKSKKAIFILHTKVSRKTLIQIVNIADDGYPQRSERVTENNEDDMCAQNPIHRSPKLIDIGSQKGGRVIQLN